MVNFKRIDGVWYVELMDGSDYPVDREVFDRYVLPQMDNVFHAPINSNPVAEMYTGFDIESPGFGKIPVDILITHTDSTVMHDVYMSVTGEVGYYDLKLERFALPYDPPQKDNCNAAH